MTKLFYSSQDLRTRVKPGSLVYPYFGDRDRPNRLGTRWGTFDKKLVPILNYLYLFRVVPDKCFLPVLWSSTTPKKTFKFAKVFHLEKSKLFVHRITMSVKHPNPIGIYLGEVIQITRYGVPQNDLFFARVLTTEGHLVWVG